MSPIHLSRCLHDLCMHADRQLMMGHQVSIHMPYIGCGLGGYTWEEVLPTVEGQVKFHQFMEVYVYEYKG